MSHSPVVVIGAGSAGISVALSLKDLGVASLVLDRAKEVASSWRSRYDRLKLNSCRSLSELPGRRFPAGTPSFPTRDQQIEYLERHVRDGSIDLQLGQQVSRIDAHDGGWVLHTAGDDVFGSQVVVATGFDNEPSMPAWPGRSQYTGTLIHSSEYRNPESFRDRKVLVVGPGCSGMEIAYDLAEGGSQKVWLSIRTPPNVMLRSCGGDYIGNALLLFPLRFADAFTRLGQRMDVGDLAEYGLPLPEERVFSRIARTGMSPTIVDKEVIEAIKARRFEIVASVADVGPAGAELSDGTRLDPDAIICATGYRTGLEPLVGHLSVLDGRGLPRAFGETATAPGLRFVGFVSRPGALGYMGKEGKRAAKAIARELRSAPRATRPFAEG